MKTQRSKDKRTHYPQLILNAAKDRADAASTAVRDAQVIRFRPVEINVSLLKQAAADPNVSNTGQVVRLNLFDDARFIAELDRIEPTANGTAWIGHLRGIEHSQVTLVWVSDTVSGNITLPGARYHIRLDPSGGHEVQQIDSSLFRE